jgi:hypothetical protein
VVALSLSFLAIVPVPAQAYIGPGSGVEFIPQFLALLAYTGAAAGAILLWPFFKVIRLIRGKNEPTNEVKTETVPEMQGAGGDKP